MPALSIGVVVRDQPERVRQTLASLSAHTPSFDLCLIGDAPNEAALSLMSEVKSAKTLLFDILRGNAACFNRLVELKPAELYLLLEGGALVTEGWLGRLLAALRRYPKCGLAGPSTNRSTNAQGIFPDASDSVDEIRRIAVTCDRRFGSTCRSVDPL